MSFKPAAALLHASAAAVMIHGYSSLSTVVADTWIRKQKGGHFQFLTIQGLTIAFIAMLVSMAVDMMPTFTTIKRIKRLLVMIALPLAVVISTIYWTLILLAPTLLLPKDTSAEPSSSTTAPLLVRLPLRVDLELHAAPAASLLTDFVFFERQYTQKEAWYGAAGVAFLAGLWYACWVEYCAGFNGTFPYPFLTENSFSIRVIIYLGATTLAWVSFLTINALHPKQFRGMRGVRTEFLKDRCSKKSHKERVVSDKLKD